ncbi:MAG: HIT domain-containing protein [Bacteroidota bacterium]|jgi:histidine triad (HIT) family protein
MPEDCVFCRIIARTARAEILHENEEAIAILDTRPIHFGHALIIPKVHCRTFIELPSDSLGGVMESTRLVCRALVSSFQLEGFNIFSNNGEVAGQSIFHFHWHITPRYANDNIRFELKLKQYPDGEMATYANRIRAHIHSTV